VAKVGRILVVWQAAADWVVCEEATGREFGHYATRTEAEAVGVKLARKRRCELIIQDEGGKPISRPTSRGWLGRLLDR
jgi:hypothetical protein